MGGCRRLRKEEAEAWKGWGDTVGGGGETALASVHEDVVDY